MRQVGGVAVPGFGAHFVLEECADLLAAHADGRQDDVAGRLVEQLHDPLAEVAFDGVDAPFAEEGREPALFREHRLALDEVVSAVPADEVPDDGVHLGGILRPVDLHAVGRGVAFEFTEVVAQAAQRVSFDLGRQAAQLLPFGDTLHHPVAFSRTAYSALSCHAMRSASATNRFAAFEWLLMRVN